jgi:hypothetical protein
LLHPVDIEVLSKVRTGQRDIACHNHVSEKLTSEARLGRPNNPSALRAEAADTGLGSVALNTDAMGGVVCAEDSGPARARRQPKDTGSSGTTPGRRRGGIVAAKNSEAGAALSVRGNANALLTEATDTGTGVVDASYATSLGVR